MKPILQKIEKLQIVSMLLAACWSAPTLSGAALEQNDAGRILLLQRAVNRREEGTFLVFLARDENERAVCVPLSGSGNPENLPAGSWRATPYFRDTPPYEILLDLCCDYGNARCHRSSQLRSQCEERYRLLKVLGHQELSEVLLTLDGILRRSRSSCSGSKRKFQELAAASSPDEDAIHDLADNLTSLLREQITEALSVVTQILNRDDPMLAIAAYLHIRSFCAEFISGRSSGFYFRGRDMLTDLNNALPDLFRQCETDIFSLLRRRCANQPQAKEFRALFPKARGLWSESPPANFAQLQEYFSAFHRCHQEEREYAPVADFEQWGNLRLALLSGTASGKETAYLEQEFQAALRKYQQVFSPGSLKK